MPTSSIFNTVRIKTDEEAEMFLSALEAAENAPAITRETPNMRYVTDPDEIKRMLEKRSLKAKTPFEALMITYSWVMIKAPKGAHSFLLSFLF